MRRCIRRCAETETGLIEVEIEVDEMKRLWKADTAEASPATVVSGSAAPSDREQNA